MNKAASLLEESGDLSGSGEDQVCRLGTVRTAQIRNKKSGRLFYLQVLA